MGWVVNATPRPLYPGKDTQYPLYRRLCGPHGRTGRERKISPPTRIQTPDHRVRSESLYRLSHPGPRNVRCEVYFSKPTVPYLRFSFSINGTGQPFIVEFSGALCYPSRVSTPLKHRAVTLLTSLAFFLPEYPKYKNSSKVRYNNFTFSARGRSWLGKSQYITSRSRAV